MDFENLHQILRSLYDEMMPLCEDMAGVAKGIAGLGALFYVAYRVWQSLARAEPIDVFPMLRPFAIGLCIMFFPTVVLAILGPIAFAISVWDGFQSTLTQWICRYIQVYLWLPVSDMFSTILAKIQVLMLQSDIERMQADPNFSLDSSDGVYIVFMIIGIIGYFTIPTVAGWIIQAGGMGSYGRNVNQTAGRVGGFAGSVAGATAGNTVGRFGKLLKRT